ncbi:MULTISPECIES: glycerate kinase type-2 family protein [Salinibaculum]|uniref:glycerate kinase type-2 family protein n=1 Tax=Salinibaculum TaxID=2732368 RepID=UPI0030CC3589
MFTDRERIEHSPLHGDALDCVAAGIDAAHPERVVRETVAVSDGTMTVQGETCDLDGYDRLLVVGGGNAAGTAASAVEGVLGDRIDAGAVVTDDSAPTERIDVLAGDHPVPSETGVESTRRMLEVLDSAGENDLVLVLVTGGGSALMTAPAEGIALADLQALTDALLRSGADIGEINAIRKHVSQIKGGRLAAAAAPATVVGLVFSDVVGNDLATIASGPIAPDQTTYADALSVLDRYGVDAPSAVRDHLEAGADGDVSETPGPGSPAFERVTNYVLADGLTAIKAAADTAAERGYEPVVLSSRIRGEASEAAKTHAAIAEECRASGHPAEPPVALVSGGETTVTGPGDGTGGPNQEFALQVAVDLEDSRTVLACVDTDGIDGATDAAGALVDHRTVDDADAAREALAAHDVHPFLDDRGAILETGPTGTNVNDLRVHLVGRTDESGE